MLKLEFWQALMKGIGFHPTNYALRWSPTFPNVARFELLELQRCETDGALVPCANSSQALLRLHPGHRLKSPVTFGFLEFILIQLRFIR